MTPRFRFIASNLHVGGGVQVGASLIDEVAALADDPRWADLVAATSFEVSPSVAANAQDTSLARLDCQIVMRRPLRPGPVWRDLRRPVAGSLVVFGPIYSLPRASRRVLGYADVTSVYPPVVGTPTWRARLRGRLSRAEAAAQDLVIVETTAMAAQVGAALGPKRPRVLVVPNAVNGRFASVEEDLDLARRVQELRGDALLVLAYPTRPYAHKNLGFLPRVARELELCGTRARFLLTLTDAEWEGVGHAVRSVSRNVGELRVAQVATLMRAADGVFFPSLLEAYSATPLEALATGVPLFASDRDFVRSVCGDAAAYFDPLDPASAAESVSDAMSDPEGATRRRNLGRQLVAALPGPGERAKAMLAALYDASPREAAIGEVS